MQVVRFKADMLNLSNTAYRMAGNKNLKMEIFVLVVDDLQIGINTENGLRKSTW
jgi:hypothetical protein